MRHLVYALDNDAPAEVRAKWQALCKTLLADPRTVVDRWLKNIPRSETCRDAGVVEGGIREGVG